MEQSEQEINAPLAIHTPLSDEAIEAKLAQLLMVSRLIDTPVETAQDWQARKDCEDLYCQIDDELRSAAVRFSYSRKAGRFLRERYRLVLDGHFTEHGRRIPCWTLIDTQADEGRGAPVLVSPPLTQRVQEEAHALALPLDPFPTLYKMPIRTSEVRAQAHALCERWNLAAAHLCPQCGLRFPEGDLPEEEQPYLNRAQLLCSTCTYEKREKENDLIQP